MARFAPWRLDPASYPHSVAIQTRFSDLDPLGHINNVAFGGLFEAARVRFNQSLGLTEFRGHRWLIARIEIDYLAEAYHPADMLIATGIAAIGNRSWRLAALATQDGRAVALCEAVLVMEAKQDAPGLPPAFREQLERFAVQHS